MPLTPLLWALEFQSQSPVKLNQFVFLTFCPQKKKLFKKKKKRLQGGKKIISLDLFIQENTDSFIAMFKPEIRILFEEDDYLVVNGLLFVLTRSSR